MTAPIIVATALAVRRRTRLFAGLLILMSATVCGATGSSPVAGRRAAEILVDLDARDASAGTDTWANRGTLGPFKRLGHPSIAEVGGVRAVSFDGREDGYRGPASAAELEGRSPRTIEAWAYNPWVDSEEETIVSWGKRGGPVGSLFAFGWGKNPNFGASAHWGADLGWKLPPSSGKWHYLVYTYDGRAARVFDNGVEQQSLEIALNTAGGQPVLLGAQTSAAGATQFKNEVTGEHLAGSLSLASLRITARALTADEIKQSFKAESARFGAEVDPRWRELYRGKFQYITGACAVGVNLLFFDSPQPSIQDGGDVYSWDFASRKAVHRLKVDEQGLYQYRAYGSTLYIAGCDATEDWSFGNFYKSLDAGLTWRKYRTVPHAMHVFDICRWQGSLVVGASTTEPAGAAVCFSRDDGETWRSELVEPAPAGGWGRVLLVVPTAAGLYAHYTTSAGTTGWKTRTVTGWHDAVLPHNLWMRIAFGTLGPSRWKQVGKGSVALGLHPFGLAASGPNVAVVPIPAPIGAPGPAPGQSTSYQDIAMTGTDAIYALTETGLVVGSLEGLWRGEPNFKEVLRYPPGQFGLSVEVVRNQIIVGTFAPDGGRLLVLER